jgi:formylglycine-generating enzyme required for sulfatase activity
MISLSGFWIDSTEVTVARYRTCVQAGKCSPAATGQACNQGIARKDDHPINCVSWYQADGYCAWAGARLPSEAQWEKAARGVDGRLYPWGNDPPNCSVVVWYDPDGGHGCGKHSTWPVGSKPGGQSACGALDLAGNVWEWAADFYDSDYYAVAPDTDPKGPAKGLYKVLRGGGWGHDGPTKQRSGTRLRFAPANQTPGTGFRCALSG